MTEPILAPLANWIANYRLAAEDEKLQARLWMTFMDWSSALIAGTGHPLFETYMSALLHQDETGPASVIAKSGQFPISTAAQANAAISHFWEVDDAHRDSTTHPGITVIPGVLALAEALKLDAETTTAAIVTGFETILRVGGHFGPKHYSINHTTATAGTMGAAAAAAKALKLDSEKTLYALGHAGTQAAGLWAFLDDNADDAKAFHPAIAVRNGIAAARLAAAGIRSASRILEGPRGMRASWHLDDLDDSWLVPDGPLMIHSVTVKGWPVCGQMHSLLDAAVNLSAKYPELAKSDTKVVVELPHSAIAIAGRKQPKTVPEAKFSTSFCVAAVLCGRPPTFTGLNDDLLADNRVHQRAEQIMVKEAPEFTSRFPAERPARISINNGDSLVLEERSFRKGDPEAPWTEREIVQRTQDVLALANGNYTTVDELSTWSGMLANGSPQWRASTLFELIGSK